MAAIQYLHSQKRLHSMNIQSFINSSGELLLEINQVFVERTDILTTSQLKFTYIRLVIQFQF